MPIVIRVTEFSVCTKEPLWILFLAYSSFDNCIFSFEPVLSFQFHAKITTFFRSRNGCYGSSLRCWCRNIWQKLTWKWRQDVKISYWHHAQKSSYTPHVRRHFLSPFRDHRNPGQVCKNWLSKSFGLFQSYHIYSSSQWQELSQYDTLK